MPLSAEPNPNVFGRSAPDWASEAARFLRILPLLAAAALQLACGGTADPDVEREVESREPERSAYYPVEGPSAATPCGWLPMPNGQLDYVPCPSAKVRSPISDPPDQEGDDLGGAPPIVRPDPPGDPPPF